MTGIKLSRIWELVPRSFGREMSLFRLGKMRPDPDAKLFEADSQGDAIAFSEYWIEHGEVLPNYTRNLVTIPRQGLHYMWIKSRN